MYQRKYLDWLAKQLSIKKMEEWYHVKLSQVRRRRGNGLLNIYGDSLYNALKEVYPEHRLHSWLFQQVPAGFWNDSNNVKEYVNWLAAKFSINKPEDWNFVTVQQINELAGGTLLLKFGGLRGILSRVYPDFAWRDAAWECRCSLQKEQQLLLKTVRGLLLPMINSTQKTAKSGKLLLR